jgi:GNAT superfamily N-acetyltransferase
MPTQITTRPIREADYAQWRPLWDGYNAIYGRSGDNALPENITACTWARFFDGAESVHAFVAEADGRVVGLVHYLFHRSTTRLNDVCYLQDLFTEASLRGRGIGRRLIEDVCTAAARAGASRVYWTTHETNQAGRLLYDHGFIVYSREV